MSVYHDEIEIEDMEYDEETETYYYPCPCGDRFEITKVNIDRNSSDQLIYLTGRLYAKTQNEVLKHVS